MTQPPPPGWYPGAPWQPPPRPRKTNTGLIIGLVIGTVFLVMLGGCAALIVIGSAAGNHASKTSQSSFPALPPISVPSVSIPPLPSITITTTTKPPPAAIGQGARDGDTTFTVNSISQSKVAGDLSNPYMQVTAQGVFLNVHLTVTNSGTKPQTFFASNQKLKIGDSTYEANGSAAMWTSAMNVTINPGNSIQVVLSFDVPAGTVINGTVQLHESIISKGVEVALS